MSLRDQLAKKRAQRRSVRFPIGPEGSKAQADLGQALQAVQLARLSGGADTLKNAETWRRKAERALEAHSMTVAVRGLSNEERDTLNSAHPATATQQAEDDKLIAAKQMKPEERRMIDVATWLPAALEIVAEDSDLTEKEWGEELADPSKWTAGEKDSLFRAVVSATQEGPSPGIPLD